MSQYLSAMGITQWRQRLPQEPIIEFAEPSLPTPRFVFVAEASQADHALLANITKALSCTESECQVLWVKTPAELQNSQWPDAPTIVFGENLYPYAPTHAVRSVSLNQLNNNIPAKKALWQQLKTFL